MSEMAYFWYTVETIPVGMGFSHYDRLHLFWLALGTVTILLCYLGCRKCGTGSRKVFRRGIAILLIADELFKDIPLLITGRFNLSYLPFELCSINIFLIALHAWKPGKLLDNFLYLVCIPGAMAAMLFPTWTALPGWNFMCIHSFTVHILLVLYPVVLTAAGEIRPDWKEAWKCILLLLGLAGTAKLWNRMWDTNFMFLEYANSGNPLKWFETAWGSHLYGFPVIIAGVILVMYLPWILTEKWRKKNPKIV